MVYDTLVSMHSLTDRAVAKTGYLQSAIDRGVTNTG